MEQREWWVNIYVEDGYRIYGEPWDELRLAKYWASRGNARPSYRLHIRLKPKQD